MGRTERDERRRLASLGERLDLPGEVVAWLGPGQILGVLSILDDVRRNASVRNASDVQLLVLRDRDLRSAIAEIAPLRARVMELAAQHRGEPPPQPPA